MKQLFDNTIRVLERAVNLRSKRNAVIAGNIANVDTPDYRPRDMKFRKLMENYMESSADANLSATHHDHIGQEVCRSQGRAGLKSNRDSVSFSVSSHDKTVLSTTDPMHFAEGNEEDENSAVQFSTERGTPNSIDLDREMAKLSANNLQYQAAVSALVKKFERLMTAITEGGRQ